MKKISLIICVLVMAALIPFASLEAAPKAKKKQIGIATYSVKGLESDIEGSLKALALSLIHILSCVVALAADIGIEQSALGKVEFGG